MDQRAGGADAGLERLIRAIKAEPGVWWATCKQVAEWQIETRQNLDVTVPIPPIRREAQVEPAQGRARQSRMTSGVERSVRPKM